MRRESNTLQNPNHTQPRNSGLPVRWQSELDGRWSIDECRLLASLDCPVFHLSASHRSHLHAEREHIRQSVLPTSIHRPSKSEVTKSIFTRVRRPEDPKPYSLGLPLVYKEKKTATTQGGKAWCTSTRTAGEKHNTLHGTLLHMIMCFKQSISPCSQLKVQVCPV